MDALDVTLYLARAMGLAPYEYTSSMTGGQYALNNTYRRLGMGVHLLIWGFGWSFFKNDVPVDSGHVLEGSVSMIAAPVLFLAQTLLFFALLWWQQNPHLLQALNLDIFRRLPPLGLKDIALPILATAAPVCGCAAVLSYFAGWNWTESPMTHPIVVQGSALILICVPAGNMGLFSLLLSCVRKSVDGVIDSLNEMAIGSGAAAKLEASAILALRREHKEAVMATEKLCTAFGWAVFVTVLGDLWKVVEISFLIIAMPHSPSLELLILVIDVVKSILPQALMMTVAHCLTERANSTTLTSIHAVSNSRRLLNDEVRRELKEFSRQIQQEPLVVSVRGVVVFNLPQFCQAFGLAVTYVVVLLQFRQSGK